MPPLLPLAREASSATILQTMSRSNRLEWISLVYLLFFVLAVLSPSLFEQSYFGLSEDTLEEITIFLFGIAGIITFSLYERLMERREQEHKKAQDDYHKAKMELIESYTYIGALNRKLELLKTLADDTTKQMGDGKRFSKELFQSIVANACAAAGADAALLRFMEVEKLRTDREFLHHASAKPTFRVANRDLRELHGTGASHAFIRTEDARDVLVVPSDRGAGACRAYLILQLHPDRIQEVDPSLLKVFVNQAELLYRGLDPSAAT